MGPYIYSWVHALRIASAPLSIGGEAVTLLCRRGDGAAAL